MLHSAESTQHYVAYQVAGSHDSALCNIAGSHDSVQCSIAHIREFSPQIRKYFRVLPRGLGTIDLWKKTRGRKSRETVSLNARLSWVWAFRMPIKLAPRTPRIRQCAVQSIYIALLARYQIGIWPEASSIYMGTGFFLTKKKSWNNCRN
jgi:hypothetical protein